MDDHEWPSGPIFKSMLIQAGMLLSPVWPVINKSLVGEANYFHFKNRKFRQQIREIPRWFYVTGISTYIALNSNEKNNNLGK